MLLIIWACNALPYSLFRKSEWKCRKNEVINVPLNAQKIQNITKLVFQTFLNLNRFFRTVYKTNLKNITLTLHLWSSGHKYSNSSTDSLSWASSKYRRYDTGRLIIAIYPPLCLVQPEHICIPQNHRHTEKRYWKLFLSGGCWYYPCINPIREAQSPWAKSANTLSAVLRTDNRDATPSKGAELKC